MTYPTLDYLPDLSQAQMNGARNLSLSPMEANTAGWENDAILFRSDEFAVLSEIYKLNLTAGATYTFYSSSYFDPFLVRVYDESGNTVAASTNVVSGTSSSSITLTGFNAPYSGSFYVDPGWHQGSFFTSVTIGVFEDLNLPGNLGNDNLTGNQVFAGPGNDLISGTAGTQNYLRGEDGNDIITGGQLFDDINGNVGNDTAHGGLGDDWVVGGKDNDALYGDSGNDIVWGNLGNDTCDGGDGNDQVRGGQGDDSVSGGAGNDYVSGDRGNDTISGGAGADNFHGSQDAGIDRVLDFHVSEGDRVQLDPGTSYTVSQVGADTVLDMGNGNQMILVGVQMSTLTAGWVFLG